MEPSFRKKNILQNTPKIVLLFTLVLILLTIIPLYYPTLSSLFLWDSLSSSSSSKSYSYRDDIDGFSSNVKSDATCDIFTGEWVRNPEAPYYTNTTCWAIHDHQNCMRYGRPDTDFMKWRWKPDGCELPVFNPSQFLELMRGKSLAFVGDSVGRNQMQSLICLLSRVSTPLTASLATNCFSKLCSDQG